MSEFNIQNSKVEQVNDGGNNYKFTGNSNTNAISEKGNVVQTTGTGNKVQVDHSKPSLLSMLWTKIKACWKWLTG
jgi:hypothetical protein